MTATETYISRRGELETYFDRTAVDAWKKLTSDAPVSGVRATVRAGRDAMRATLFGLLPADLRGLRLLDAGCGAGQFAIEAGRRGADVVAVDLSPTLVNLARERAVAAGVTKVDFHAGDMFAASLGRFDHVVAMDSVIHYEPSDVVDILERFADRAGASILFTIAPQTPLLSVMHAAGKLFPRGDKSPAIVPISPAGLGRRIAAHDALAGWRLGRAERINSGFYISQAMELVRA